MIFSKFIRCSKDQRKELDQSSKCNSICILKPGKAARVYLNREPETTPGLTWTWSPGHPTCLTRFNASTRHHMKLSVAVGKSLFAIKMMSVETLGVSAYLAVDGMFQPKEWIRWDDLPTLWTFRPHHAAQHHHAARHQDGRHQISTFIMPPSFQPQMKFFKCKMYNVH